MIPVSPFSLKFDSFSSRNFLSYLFLMSRISRSASSSICFLVSSYSRCCWRPSSVVWNLSKMFRKVKEENSADYYFFTAAFQFHFKSNIQVLYILYIIFKYSLRHKLQNIFIEILIKAIRLLFFCVAVYFSVWKLSKYSLEEFELTISIFLFSKEELMQAFLLKLMQWILKSISIVALTSHISLRGSILKVTNCSSKLWP